MRFTQLQVLVLGLGLIAGNSAAKAETVQVNIQSHSFLPSPLTIHVGDTVNFVNQSALPHTVTADPALAKDPTHVILPAGVEPFDSGTIKASQTFSHTFTTVGTYQYICRFHESMGMIGTIQVIEETHPVSCNITYSSQAKTLGELTLSGETTGAGGVAISEDFTINGIVANLHVVFNPGTDFASINYFHQPTDTVINTDTTVVKGKEVSIFGRTKQIDPSLNGVQVACTFL